MNAVITVGGDGRFVFSAAHAGLHDGQFEPLHGHSFTVALRLHGDLDQGGMVCDFGVVKAALGAVIAPLRRRTLMPARPPGGRCIREDGQVVVECGGKHYSLPAGDVVVLPVVNTTTEVIAAWLLGQVMPRLEGTPVRLAELVLTEAPGVFVTVSSQPGAG
jgi:6-pyruvoyl-tetrahydropterin synthase